MGKFQHTGYYFSNYQSLLQTHNGISPRNPNSKHCAYSEEDLSFKDPLKVALRGERIEIGRDRKLLLMMSYTQDWLRCRSCQSYNKRGGWAESGPIIDT